jgi:hypothetical protein
LVSAVVLTNEGLTVAILPLYATFKPVPVFNCLRLASRTVTDQPLVLFSLYT